MKAKEIRDLSVEEIDQRIVEEREQLRQLSFQHAIADLQNPMILRQKRRFPRSVANNTKRKSNN